MVLKESFSDGSQEWFCPRCGRQIILHWPPHYQQTLLKEGDIQAIHSGATGSQGNGSAQAPFVPDDQYLEPFKRWMDKRDKKS